MLDRVSLKKGSRNPATGLAVSLPPITGPKSRENLICEQHDSNRHDEGGNKESASEVSSAGLLCNSKLDSSGVCVPSRFWPRQACVREQLSAPPVLAAGCFKKARSSTG
jgi:hypothetical protein